MKKIILTLILLLAASSAYADNTRKIEKLIDEKYRLTATYENKERELSAITLRIHEIDQQISDLKLEDKGKKYS